MADDQMLKVLITGANGMLGRTLNRVLSGDFCVIPTDLHEADITDQEAFSAVVKKYAPDVVIHCAAMVQVDDCETLREKAFRINAEGTRNVAECCAQNNIRLIAISTDYVFDGKSDTPYSEYDAPGNAATVYGKSKFAGEEAVRELLPDNSVICRISWLYGDGGPSFVHTMLKLAASGKTNLKVVNDQFGNPTSTDAVAGAIRNILSRRELTGVFHLTCEGVTTWMDFARKIFEFAGIDCTVNGCTTEEFPRPAPRPRFSALEKRRLREENLPPMPHWEEALRVFINQQFNQQGVSK